MCDHSNSSHHASPGMARDHPSLLGRPLHELSLMVGKTLLSIELYAFTHIPKAVTFQHTLRSAVGGKLEDYQDKITNLGQFLARLIDAAIFKLSNPTDKVDLSSDLEKTDLNDIRIKLDGLATEINEIIETHNKAHDDFAKLQENAFVKIRDHVLAYLPHQFLAPENLLQFEKKPHRESADLTPVPHQAPDLLLAPPY